VRALVVFGRLFPFVLAFLLDRRRFLVIGRPRRRDAERHRRRAERLTRTLADLGPTFIKLAQVFAARADILPEPYLSAVSTLTDQVPPLPLGVAERVVREELGRMLGSFTQLAVVMKGLPLTYSKDMQEDKVPVFEAFDALELSLRAMAGMVADLEPAVEAMEKAAGAGFSTATDLADWLVRELSLPFRDAHHITGAAVKRAEQLGCDLPGLPLAELKALEPRITQGVYKVLTPQASVASRMSYGGTAPDQVRAQIQRWKGTLA
jgi:hypothetical protein